MIKMLHKKKKPTALTVGSKRIYAIPHKHNGSIANITWKSQAVKVIKCILTASGFVTFLFACCITTTGDDKWYVPMLIGLGGMGLVGIAVLIDYRQQFKANKQKRRRDRHCGDADKLRQSEDMKNTYNELILNQIWQ